MFGLSIYQLFEYYVIGGGIVVLCALAWWVWRSRIRVYSRAMFYVPAGDAKLKKLSDYKYTTMRFIGEKVISHGQKYVDFKYNLHKGKKVHGSLKIDWSKPSIVSPRITSFSFDIVNDMQILYVKGSESAGDKKAHSVALRNNLVQKAVDDVKGLDDNVKLLLLSMAVLCFVCAVMGYALYPIISGI